MTFEEIARANLLHDQLMQVRAAMKVLAGGRGVKLHENVPNTGTTPGPLLLTIDPGGVGAGALRHALLGIEADVRQNLLTLGITTEAA